MTPDAVPRSSHAADSASGGIQTDSRPTACGDPLLPISEDETSPSRDRPGRWTGFRLRDSKRSASPTGRLAMAAGGAPGSSRQVPISSWLLPFAEAATPELPLPRLLRLGLFQVSVGMAVVMVLGTLNRVMIVELGVPAWLVAAMIALPLIFAPARAVIGYKSDIHRSAFGVRRVPYLWFGSMLQFGGLAIMPFALIVLSGMDGAPALLGEVAAALAFVLVGAGLHTVQTVGLALATDLAPREKHPQVVALLCGMLLVGMIVSAIVFGIALSDFSPDRLIQVVQASAVATMALNGAALWKQEPRSDRPIAAQQPMSFRAAWQQYVTASRSTRALVVVGLGTVAFSMQDVLLEPYGGQILDLPVAMTTKLTALLAVGGLVGFAVSARALGRGLEPYRLTAMGALAGVVAFSCVLLAPLASPVAVFALGTVMVGFGSALFLVSTLSAAMGKAKSDLTGLALGTWGAVQAFSAGSAIAIGGALKDGVQALANHGTFGPNLAAPIAGYSFVYSLEILLLLATLVAVLPLLRRQS